MKHIFVLIAILLATAASLQYNVDIELSYWVPNSGSVNDFYLVLIGDNGSTTPSLVNGTTDRGNTYRFVINDIDIGTINYAKLVSFEIGDTLAVDSITVNSIYSAAESVAYLEYDGPGIGGCEVLTATFADDSLTIGEPEEIPCTTIDYASLFAQNDTSIYKIYSIEIQIYAQGGSTDDIFVAIENINGNVTDFVSIGALTDAGSGKTYPFDLNLTNIGTGAKLYILSYGRDSLFVQGCSIDGVSTSEFSYDIVQYDGADPRGCQV